MKNLKKYISACAGLLLLAMTPVVAMAADATTLPGGIHTVGGQYVGVQPFSVVTYDSATGLPCLLGTSSTCQMDLGGQAISDLDSMLNSLNTPAAQLPPLSPTSDVTLGLPPLSSTTTESCHVLKASAGNFYSAEGYIGAAGWILLYNAISAPADGATTPVAWVYAPAAGIWSLDYGAIPLALSTGATICASSTGPFTKTAYSTAVFSGRVK